MGLTQFPKFRALNLQEQTLHPQGLLFQMCPHPFSCLHGHLYFEPEQPGSVGRGGEVGCFFASSRFGLSPHYKPRLIPRATAQSKLHLPELQVGKLRPAEGLNQGQNPDSNPALLFLWRFG